jgi:ubiquinone/menaquinone biosynthesis C-methylase UbiE
MELEIGRRLIETAVARAGIQVWADLGAGEGFFTKVLASLLPHGSLVYAIDKDSRVLAIKHDVIPVAPIVANFTTPPDNLESLDGILVANALHYVRDKKSFLDSWRKKLKANGQIIVVEYDTSRPNQWVPYPLSYTSLQNLGKQLNVDVVLLGTAPSAYQAGGIYACKLAWP